MFIDYDVTFTGQNDDVKKKTYHDFLILFDDQSNLFEIKSNIYYDSNEKFQKEEFIQALLNRC